MKKSKEETAKSRERILTSASRRFRAGGFGGVSVKDLMGEAGLTHGAFYAHFPSKEALMGAACTEALRETTERLAPRAGATPEETLAKFLDSYLSMAHVDTPSRGCAVAVLGAEVARESGEVKQAFSAGVGRLIDRMAGLLPGEDEDARQTRAINLFAEAIGTVVLARAVAPGPLQARILEAARSHLLDA